jgi:hypothetical protein
VEGRKADTGPVERFSGDVPGTLPCCRREGELEPERVLHGLKQRFIIENVGKQSVEAKLRYARESIELGDRPGADPLSRPVAFHNLAFIVWESGERERVVGLNRISARLAREMGARVTSGMAFFQARAARRC